MDKYNIKRKEDLSNKISNENISKNETKVNKPKSIFDLDYNSYSEDEIFENTYNINNNIKNNTKTNLENSIQKNKIKEKLKKQNKARTKHLIKENMILIPSDNKNILYNNLHSTLKQSNSNNNYMRKISNTKINESNSNNNKNKFAKIKNPKKKKDINQIKGKYKSLKHMMENSENKMIKGKINNKKENIKNENNLFYNKYVKEENKMINYNYFVLNPKNITENKKTENNLIQNIIKYPINKSSNNNKNIYQDKIPQKNKTKNKNKDLYIYLRNSFYKENDIEKDDYLTNSQEILYDALNPNPNLHITETINQNNNLNKNNNKEHIQQFSRTFVEIKDIKTIEPKKNDEFKIENLNLNQNIIRPGKKSGKSYKKKLLNNSITQNKNISKNNNRVKKNNLTIEIFLNKNKINALLNTNKIKLNNINPSLGDNITNNNIELKTPLLSQAYPEKDYKKKYSYNNSINNTINNITKNKTIMNKNESILNIKNTNKNLSLNKKSKLTIYKKRKISNHKCQSKIKKTNLKESDNNTTHNYFTESKKSNNLNDFIQITQNVKKVDLFKILTSGRKSLKINSDNNINNINNTNNNIIKDQKEKQSSYIYTKNIFRKIKKNSKNNFSISNLENIDEKNGLLNTKVINASFCFMKKYRNFIIKKPVIKIYHITKRTKFRAPINKLCIFSKNIILKEGQRINNQSNIDEGNNTIIELNSSKFNNTNKNMEILEEIDDNDNEDFNIEEYEKNNKLNNSLNLILEERPKKIFKIEKGLEKLCRIFFRNLEIKNKKIIKNELNCANCVKNLNLKKEKSEPNINFKTKKISGLFSSTIQNWNCIDKKNYKKEDENDNDIPINKINKKRKRKKHSLLLNIHKAFSEEKIREQIQTERRSVNINSRFLFIKNQNDFIINQQINKEIGNNNNDIINQKDKYINIINNLNKENYSNSLTALFKLISNQDNENNNINTYNYNNFEILLNNQFTFIEIIVENTIKERKDKINISLLAKLCYDLYIKFISDFIYINKKKSKSENLKSILKSECKQKFDECDIITLLTLSNKNLKKEKNFLEKIKTKLLGIIDFIIELIKVKMISQKMGLEYLDNLKKRINSFDEDIKKFDESGNLKDIKNLYFEGELNLLRKISKIIIERKKPKHLQNLKNFIDDNIIPIIIDKTIEQNLGNKFIDFLNEIKRNEFFKDINIDNNNK